MDVDPDTQGYRTISNAAIMAKISGFPEKTTLLGSPLVSDSNIRSPSFMLIVKPSINAGELIIILCLTGYNVC